MNVTPPEDLTWSQLFAELTGSPLSTVQKVLTVFIDNVQQNWITVFLLIIFFWLLRKIIFSFVDFIVPRSLSVKPPRWARVRAITLWRDRLYKQSLASRRLNRAQAVVSLMKSFIDPFMGVIAFLVIFKQLGISTDKITVTWLIGGLSLAIGLGAQGLVKDILAGIAVLMSDAYAVGDYVNAQLGAAGVVKHIGVRLTALEGNDGTIWYVRHSEVHKMGNRTASRAIVVMDVTLTWNEQDKHVFIEDLKFAEMTLDSTIRELAEVLEGVDRVARDVGTKKDNVPLSQIAAVVPDLVPAMGADTLWDMKAIKSDNAGHRDVQEAVQKIPGRVPIFTKVESLGLINSTKDSVTIRLRVALPPNSSRSQGTAVLRRAVFETFTPFHITPQFEEAPEGSLLMTESALGGYYDQ